MVNCTVIPGGSASCTDTGATNVVYPFGLNFASSDTKVLIANAEVTRTKDITSCDYANGVLSSCVYTATKVDAPTTGMNGAQDVVVVGTYAYYSYYNIFTYGEPPRSSSICPFDGVLRTDAFVKPSIL